MVFPTDGNKLVASFYSQAAELNFPLVFAEGEDDRVIAAAERLAKLCCPILLTVGKPISVSADIEVVDVLTDSRRISFANQLAEIEKYKDQDPTELVNNPLLFAALLVKNGYARGGISGAHFTTAEVLRAGLNIVGKAQNIQTVSSSFLMIGEQSCYSFADCAIVIEPTAHQLVDIALATIHTHRRLVEEQPRVAFLSFSTKGSAEHPQIDKVRQATRQLRKDYPTICCDGELQLDAALVPSVAQLKAPDSPIGGQANILIFPNLASGNIGYKLTQYIGRLQAIGPIVQGLSAPFMDLSRGCSSDDLVLMSCLTSILAKPDADV